MNSLMTILRDYDKFYVPEKYTIYVFIVYAIRVCNLDWKLYVVVA